MVRQLKALLQIRVFFFGGGVVQLQTQKRRQHVHMNVICIYIHMCDILREWEEMYSAIKSCSSQLGYLTLNSLEIYLREEFICHSVLRIFLIEISQMCRILRPGRIPLPLFLSHTSSSPALSLSLTWLLTLISKTRTGASTLPPKAYNRSMHDHV